MAEKDDKKKAAPAAKKAAPAKATVAKATAKKAAEPKAAEPKAATTRPRAAKAEAKPAKAPARRAVARPITRVVRPEAPKPERRPREEQAEAPRPKAEPRPLPTAPAGHAPLIAADGTAGGSVELPGPFATVGEHKGVLFQALIAARANARQANSATKNRTRVAGGGAKPWRQKGTGRARQGSTRSPHWRHGGVVFGPNGRRYEQRMPHKMRRAAFAQALAAHAANGRVLVVEELRFDGDRPRSRDVVDWLGRIGDTGRAVIVTADPNDLVARATANVRDVELRTAGTLRLTDVLRAQTVVVDRPALYVLAARATVGSES